MGQINRNEVSHWYEAGKEDKTIAKICYQDHRIPCLRGVLNNVV